MKKTNTLIIGASAAGLACAACLSKQGVDYLLIEKHTHTAHGWRNHYDGLHLHTPKSGSHLPYLKFPKVVSKYPSRKDVVSYFESYQKKMGIEPIYNSEVSHIKKANKKWLITSSESEYIAENLILCTGLTNIPHKITKPGIESFPGKIIHSSEYRNGKEFEGQSVLVIGFGNSACEIAICLHEHGANPFLSVRSAVNVIPRDILGIPVLQMGIAQASLPPRLSDKLNRPILKLIVGNIEKYGLKKLPYGPTEQIVKHHKIPLLDIGTMALIKKGEIKVVGDIISIKGSTIQFENGETSPFDAIIMGTGWESGLEKIIALNPDRTEDLIKHHKKRSYFGAENLYFCGFYVAPTGMLREIGIEARAIARDILEKERA